MKSLTLSRWQEVTPFYLQKRGGVVFSRQDFYTFAVFYGFQTCLERRYVPAEGDQVLFCWQEADSDVTATLAEIVYKFGRPHIRLFTESGIRDSSLPRDFLFLGRMVRVSSRFARSALSS